LRRVRTSDKVLYLTFDDGPIPEVTPWVLDTLKEYQAKATFFCIGRNIERNPDVFQRLLAEGHRVGNHTFDHPSGWETGLFEYLRNTLHCQQFTRTGLFRPPYGRITLSQARALARRFQLVFWDVLSEDFDANLSAHKCLRNVLAKARPGSIIVFHDSLLAEDRVRYALPRTLEHFAHKGYRFESLPGGTTI
jgi:peptidoglycan/xylan/chitin deacetylase (PgdA/CDA1 family)